ncbi:Uncharacterized protein HZ326_31667 [Fusarium oxysporum f. sp. albedinis]|nr:Uncharacterized protein HZ326_31667 [Fusarium oxysporum f. sp. albedinis]
MQGISQRYAPGTLRTRNDSSLGLIIPHTITLNYTKAKVVCNSLMEKNIKAYTKLKKEEEQAKKAFKATMAKLACIYS